MGFVWISSLIKWRAGLLGPQLLMRSSWYFFLFFFSPSLCASVCQVPNQPGAHEYTAFGNMNSIHSAFDWMNGCNWRRERERERERERKIKRKRRRGRVVNGYSARSRSKTVSIAQRRYDLAERAHFSLTPPPINERKKIIK
ncbi:hypothetical protein NL108_015205 [Boleophthalmus pectinirostris]|nr:hypothetical protein NL108_015205 [Boleophthalmus pectinirostris]